MSRQFNNITDQESYPKKKVFNVSNLVTTFKVNLAWVCCYNCKELDLILEAVPSHPIAFKEVGV